MIEEKFISGKSVIHTLSPVVRILSAVVLSVCAALCDNLTLGFAYLLISIVLIVMAQLSWMDVLRRLKPLLGFLLMIWVLLPLTFDGEVLFQVWIFEFTRPGVLMCAKITVKSITILLFFTSLIATMSVASLGRGLHKIHVPDKLVFLLLMSYRYIYVIQNEYRRLLRAAKFRGFKPGTNLHSYKTFAYLAGMLFVRASIRGQRVHKAMLCRGFNKKFYSLDIYHATILNWIFLSGVLVVSVSLALFDIFGFDVF